MINFSMINILDSSTSSPKACPLPSGEMFTLCPRCAGWVGHFRLRKLAPNDQYHRGRKFFDPALVRKLKKAVFTTMHASGACTLASGEEYILCWGALFEVV